MRQEIPRSLQEHVFFFVHAVNKNAAENPHGNLKGDKSDIKKQRQARQDLKALSSLTAHTSHGTFPGRASESRKTAFNLIFSTTFRR